MSDDSPMKITISPEPSTEELVVIVSAVTSALREGTQALPYDSGDDLPQASRWARQGRLEAMGGLDRPGHAGNAVS